MTTKTFFCCVIVMGSCGLMRGPCFGGPGVDGDFNGDGNWDCVDINALTAAIAGGSTDLSFDMNGNGAVTIHDITDEDVGWLAVGGANNSADTGGYSFLMGDANLDGSVDVSDFNGWNESKFTSVAEWCSGDFNADGGVDVRDFNWWNDYKFTSSSSGINPPLPGIPPNPDFVGRDGNPVLNPSGQEVRPRVIFRSDTGILSIDTAGLNGLVDTSVGSRIAGDDVGLISFVVGGPAPEEFLLTGLRGTNGVGTNWTGTYFASAVQHFADTIFDEYLLPSRATEIARFPAGTRLEDFGTVEIGINFTEYGPGAEDEDASGASLFGPVVYLSDFDGDGKCDITDLNLLLAEGPIAPGVTVNPGVNDNFDLDYNGIIDLDDLDIWLSDAASINGWPLPYMPGDANLDGQVDTSDFNLWNYGKFTGTRKWDRGDFNGDGEADLSDFNIWNQNKFTSSVPLSTVPEPSSVCLVVVALIGLAGASRRR